MSTYVNPLTGELVREDDWEDYQPHGDCATGCGHPATQVWQLYKGQQRFDYRCNCCVAKGRLERAQWYASQIEKLTAEYQKERESCQSDN